MRVADIYESDIEKSLSRILSLLQPVILIVMGAVVLTVLLAVLVPLTDMSSFTL
jgi:general secretion pathway protein F/type IV pilus assembly protein PilC